MCDVKRPLLNAYLDGELQGSHLEQLEAHLKDCGTCRDELERLRLVSRLLQAAPAPQVTPPARFASQLTLLLPRRDPKNEERRGPTLIWWLAPVILLGAWYFTQAAIVMNGAVNLFAQSGMLQEAVPWLSVTPQHSLWFNSTMEVLGDQISDPGKTTLTIIDLGNLFRTDMAIQLFWQIAVAVLYWAWLTTSFIRIRGRLPLAEKIKL
jgi:hypothetical protein